MIWYWTKNLLLVLLATSLSYWNMKLNENFLIKRMLVIFLHSVFLSRGCWMVLLDAAKGCSIDSPDLSKYKADFVVISFYKIVFISFLTQLPCYLYRSCKVTKEDLL
ncbi:hypothetical protein L6452_11075 [Arctium lappa]|uniref:Uncharacterized protein n=1 Tax=Arctium lappa TaxID=4217 RepID=A0ACB9DPE1_ARCLA|nr:hypothetical protein L6452_11075 [Arctium lappa]